jgi:superfamily I DNA/RNA helicase
VRKLRKRLGNLKTLLKLAHNTAAYMQRDSLLGIEIIEEAAEDDSRGGSESDSGSASSSSSDGAGSNSSSLPLLQATTGLPLLQQLYDYCVLQGDDEEDDEVADKVQLMTMHASKGKEFPCVTVLRAHEGSIPWIHKDEPGSVQAALEQERNLLYVAITRARE